MRGRLLNCEDVYVTVFTKQSTSKQVRAFLGRTIHNADATPKYLICDKGVQFWCNGFKRWCSKVESSHVVEQFQASGRLSRMSKALADRDIKASRVVDSHLSLYSTARVQRTRESLVTPSLPIFSCQNPSSPARLRKSRVHWR
jgi:hypothetical protein